LSSPSRQIVVVPAAADGALLVDALGQAHPELHAIELRADVAAGRVRVNGEECVTNRRVREGDVLEWLPGVARSARPAGERMPAVVWESVSALVIAKPAGLVTVPDRSGKEGGVHGLLDELRPGADLRIVHRLDRDTSGCLLLGKGLTAAQHFDRQFTDALVRKTYVAVVQGQPADEFVVDAFLGPDRRRPGKVVASARELPGFRPAHTSGRVRERFGQHALVELRPTTGRSHQLRVHLQSIGCPIVGDRDYGGEELLLSRLKPGYKLRKGVPERPLLARMFLHAERLSFRDLDGAAVDVECPLPEDLAVALRQLASHDERRR
jgi:RluA family pseudouridine synthase